MIAPPQPQMTGPAIRLARLQPMDPPLKSALPLAHLAKVGTLLAVRVTPKAARNQVTEAEGLIRVLVTTVPEDGKATAAAVALLAKALGLPRSRLELVRGATSRNKLFRVL